MEKNKFGLVCGKWSNCFLQFRSLQLDSINSIEFVCIHQMSAVVLDTVKQRVVERFDSVVALDNGFLANWKTEDGSEAALKGRGVYQSSVFAYSYRFRYHGFVLVFI